MAWKLRCPMPECRGTFPWDAGKPWPSDCPLCGAYIGSDGKDEVAAPYLALKGGAYKQAVDDVYRAAERTAEERIDQAVAMTPGSSRSDFSDLKVTNFRANMVEGESAAPPLPASAQQLQSHFSTAPLNQFAGGTRSGPEPNKGVKVMDRVRSGHSNIAPIPNV